MDTEKKPKKKHKILKWILGIFAVILLFLAAVAWFVNRQWKPLLREAIQNTILNASDSLYIVKFKDIKVNILTGGVQVDSISITPDLKVYQKMIDNGSAPENIVDLQVQKLILQRVNPIKVYKERKLAIRDINIQQPSLTVYYTKLGSLAKKSLDNRTVYERINGALKELKISTLFLTNVDFKYVDRSFKKPKTTHLDKMNIRLNDILIDSTSSKDTTRFYNIKDVIAEISDYDFATPDSMYHLSIKHAYVSSMKKQLVVSGVSLTPRYGEMAFSKHFEKQEERYQMQFDSIIVNQVNFNTFLDTRTVSASKVQVLNGNLSAFLNRDKPVKNIDKGKNYPHLALRRVAWGIKSDTVNLKNINISYTEFNPKTNEKGTVFFNDLKGNIYNVTNDSLSLTKKNIADAYLQTYLMGKGKLNVHIAFNLTDPNGAFRYNGSLGSMDMSTVNSLTKPLAMVSISSGKLNSMDFDIKGNLKGAGGTLTLKYEDLNVVLMKKDERENFKKMGLISLFANALLLNNANPKRDKPLVISHPYYARPSEASFFNLMWKTVFAGIKESVGVTKEKEAKLLKRAKDFKDAKAEREIRREERQKRRAARKDNK